MTRNQETLLLTVARVLRAKIRNEIYAERADDLWALNDALAPFDPSPAQQAIMGSEKAAPLPNGER